MNSKQKEKIELCWNKKNDKTSMSSVHLIEDVEKSYIQEATENILIHGDNIRALTALLPIYKDTVKCVYLDPPYNTKKDIRQFEDNFEHSVWLSFMKQRIELIYQLLKDDGFLFIQIDNNELHYLKVIMDEIFGRSCYINSIIVRADSKCYTPLQGYLKNLPRGYFTILMYSKKENPQVPYLLKSNNKSHYIFSDDWLDLSATGKMTGFGFETNELILFRILNWITKENDLVLDAFLGSGTTAVVAQMMKRRWIGIESGCQCYDFCLPRIKSVIDGSYETILKDKVNYRNGRGFKFYELKET